jgi:hypothetical protein
MSETKFDCVVVIKPENKGYDITCYKGGPDGPEVMMKTWKADRQSALWTADKLRLAYADENGNPAPVEGGLKTWERDFALTVELERALSMLTEFCTSGRRYKTQNPYTLPEIKSALKALAWAKGMDTHPTSASWMDANKDAAHTGTQECVYCSAIFSDTNPCFNSYATYDDGTHDGGECAQCAAGRGSVPAMAFLKNQEEKSA